MGMAASQARLLSITARLTDNENTGQNLSQVKMRLADQTQQINTDYMNALNATKLTVLTGFNGSQASYTDISYGLITGFDTVASGKQYVVTDKNGRVLVNKKQADAFNAGNGDLNIFLASFGYSISDMDFKQNDASKTETEQLAAKQKVHDAWDKYFKSVGIEYGDPEHDNGEEVTFGYHSNSNNSFDGYAVYKQNGVFKPINYEGTTKDQRELYDYALAITESYMGTSNTINMKTNADSSNTSMITYLTNLFNRMAQSGFYSYSEDQAKSTINDNNWFEQQIRKGELLLEYFSTTEKKFISTTVDEDNSIQEVEDERQIALVEAKYTIDMKDIENKDSKIDMELKKIDTEHNALQTEYDSVKSVVEKNIEKTFNIFS